MNSRILITTMILLCSWITHITAAEIIKKGQAGVVKLGMTEAQVMNSFPKGHVKIISKMMEGESYRMLSVCLKSKCTKPDLIAELNAKSVVDRITISSPQYQTVLNIGTGSTYAQLKKAYKNLDIAPSEGRGTLAINSQLGVSFAFDPLPPAKIKIPANALIKSIMLVSVPNR